MQNENEIKRKIRAIQDIGQITKAMYMISSSKLNKAIENYKANRFYFDKIRVTMKDILVHSHDIKHSFLEPRHGGRVAYIVIAGDKGLCGSYNHDVLKASVEHMEEGRENYIFVIGQIAREFFLARNYDVDVEFLYASQNPSFFNSREIAEDILRLYKENMMDEVYGVYTRIESNAEQSPRVFKILPVEEENFSDVTLNYDYHGDIDYQPSPKAVFDLLIPKYVIGLIHGMLLQSFASEQQARMLAMSNASRNADEMIGKLELERNRARQARITNELAEIIGGGML